MRKETGHSVLRDSSPRSDGRLPLGLMNGLSDYWKEKINVDDFVNDWSSGDKAEPQFQSMLRKCEI